MRLAAIVLTVVLGTWTVHAQENEEIVLPRQMGAINDYAAVLGGARADLEAQIETIQQNFNVQLVILATIYDPFDDAALYAQRIWESWKLGKRTALLVFVKEQTKKTWDFELRLGEEIRALFRPEHLERLERGLQHHLERQRIKTALEESVKALQAMLEGSYGQPPPSAPAGFQLSWVLILVGGLIGLGSIALGVRAFFKNRCPRCGARLRHYRSMGRRSALYRSCPYCGYARLG
ncbi:MAG: TPM domain-containing protein [Candidatus Bipolaricaulota bacterium]|nr:TPM domain-containing protein [Candidatus Bipolaricaulota bacterium]